MGRKKKEKVEKEKRKVGRPRKNKEEKKEKKNSLYRNSFMERHPVDQKTLDRLSEGYAITAWNQIKVMAGLMSTKKYEKWLCVVS